MTKQRAGLGLLEVPVRHGDVISESGKLCLEAQGNGHGSMPPAGTADADIEVAALVPLVQRNEKPEEFAQMFQKLTGHGIAKYILLDSGILTRQHLQLRNEEGISNEAHIEKQVNVVGHTELIAERHQGNGHVTDGRFLPEFTYQ